MYRVLEVSTQDRSPLEPVQVTVVPEVSVGGVVHCSNSNSFAGDNSNDGGVTSRSTHASDSRSGIQTLSPFFEWCLSSSATLVMVVFLPVFGLLIASLQLIVVWLE